MGAVLRCLSCCRQRRDNVLEEKLLDQVQRAAEAATKIADPAQFEQPCNPIGVSGGTAAFYSVRYLPDKVPPGKTPRYFIGKDLAHATDELSFYERAAKLRSGKSAEGWQILNWTFEYGGVCEMECQVGQVVEKRRQILLRNLFDQAQSLRLIDIKIGAVTAVGGWQGKSHTAALRNRAVDTQTNSLKEGYRAEGFDGAPHTLNSLLSATSRDLLHGVGQHIGAASFARLEVGGKKARRIALQRLPAAEFLSFFTHALPEEVKEEKFSAVEVAAGAMRGALRSMLGLLAAAAAVPVLQQWIGSSVALAYDSKAEVPRVPFDPRKDPLADAARINIFDWGRSELTTMDMQQALSPNQRKDRAQHWTAWVSGILRLSFEVARAYRRTYCPSNSNGGPGKWQMIRVKIWSLSQDITITDVTHGTEIGEAQLNLSHTDEPITLPLMPPQRGLVGEMFDVVRHAHIKTLSAATKTTRVVRDAVTQGKLSLGGRPTITVHVTGPHRMPEGSALLEQWQVEVVSASRMPKTETIEWCNPVATVQLVDRQGVCAQATTGVRLDTKDPSWTESFVFACATDRARRKEALCPPELQPHAPGDDIGQWQLALGEGLGSEGETHRALKEFRDAFFRPVGVSEVAKSGERRLSVVAVGADVLAHQQNAIDEERARKLQVAEERLVEAERALTDALQAQREAEEKSETLQADLDWLKEHWQGPPPPPRAPSPVAGSAEEDSPTSERARTARRRTRAYGDGGPDSPRSPGSPVTIPSSPREAVTSQECAALNGGPRLGAAAPAAASPPAPAPPGPPSLGPPSAAAHPAVSGEAPPPGGRMRGNGSGGQPSRAALDSLIQREAELQRRWESLMARWAVSAQQAPQQPAAPQLGSLMSTPSTQRGLPLSSPALGPAESPRLGGPGGPTFASVHRAPPPLHTISLRSAPPGDAGAVQGGPLFPPPPLLSQPARREGPATFRGGWDTV